MIYLAKEIELTKGKVAIVDDDDYEKFSNDTWTLSNRGYAVKNKRINGVKRTFLLHREIMNAKKGTIIDHVNCNKLDNRKENLRIADYTLNQGNTNPRVGYKGVYLVRSGKYVAKIDFRNKTHYLGQFEGPHDAARMYNFWAKDLFGEYARLNIIKEEETA